MANDWNDSAQSPRRQGSNLPPLPSSTAKDEEDLRYTQLVEEQEHKFCADDNRRELLQAKLERLRALKDELAKDEWMFEAPR